MTSNTGSRRISDFGGGVGFNTSAKQDNKESADKSTIEKELKKTFAPEFLNRIDDVVMFNSLDREDIASIIKIEVDKVIERVAGLDFKLEMNESMMDMLIDKGFDPQYGARPLKRAIQKYVEDVLTEEIIEKDPPLGSKFTLSYDSSIEEVVVKVTKSRRKREI